eukprot:Em0015g507a
MASSRVYVGDLGSGGSKPELEREFERYGPLKSVWVARNPPGFAFIEFEDPRDAEDAVRDMDGRYVCGVRIRVELAKNSSSRPGYRSNTRRGPPPNVVSSRYRRSPPRRGRSKSRSRSGSPAAKRSPYHRGRSRSGSPPPPKRSPHRRGRSRSVSPVP